MAKIAFIVPRIGPNFSGGVWCIFEYARGLEYKGHDVYIVPALPSKEPRWFPYKFRNFISSTRKERFLRLVRSFSIFVLSFFRFLLNRDENKLQNFWTNFLIDFAFFEPVLMSFSFAYSISGKYISRIMPDVDYTIATQFTTARFVYYYGKGKKFYFMQHYEALFKNDFDDSKYVSAESSIGYLLPLTMIANSSWLKKKIQSIYSRKSIYLCNNAIDHDIFYGNAKKRDKKSNKITIISYGGRGVQWKGFIEMAKAMAIARDRLNDYCLRWHVYGTSNLPPDNKITPYEALGFLYPKQLANAYRNSDFLLSASWYESFPLFPIEAMACGIPIITTPFGTEDYAFHGDTAHIVKANDVESIAEGIITLCTNPDYANKLAINGLRKARQFTWKKSINNLESILFSHEDIENYTKAEYHNL